MTEEKAPTISIADVPDPLIEIRSILKDQQAVIVKQNEAIKALTVRLNEAEKVAAAAPAATVQQQEQPKESPQDIAYKAMLKEMGITE